MSVARAVVVGHLPGSRAVAHLERDGEVCFILAADRPLVEIAEQLTECMQGNVDASTWAQNWGGPGAPPQPLRNVS